MSSTEAADDTGEEDAAAGDSGRAAPAAEGASVVERRLLDWHFANLEFANAAALRELSLRTWDQDDPHEMQGAHAFLPGALLCTPDCPCGAFTVSITGRRTKHPLITRYNRT